MISRIYSADERKTGNRRNGKTSKTVQTSDGPVELETSRDRTGTFEPELVKKRETVNCTHSVQNLI
ncbi:transposase [Fulvivirgaceae bacterium QH1ED-6-2]|nr:transposase [Parachryseolinea silvisoli]